MKVIITESQLKKLIEAKYFNYKPARDFDSYYNSNIAQTYEFPGGLSSDDAWDVIQDCWEKRECVSLFALIQNLSEEHFPYPGVEYLEDEMKADILMGMASELNFDDVVHYAIKGQNGLHDKAFNKFHASQKPSIQNRLQWISSPKTRKKIQKILKQN